MADRTAGLRRVLDTLASLGLNYTERKSNGDVVFDVEQWGQRATVTVTPHRMVVEGSNHPLRRNLEAWVERLSTAGESGEE